MLKINKTNKYNRHNKIKPTVIYKKLKNQYLIFMCHFTSFIVQNYKKIFKKRARFTLNKIFFTKITNINFICLSAPFTVENF